MDMPFETLALVAVIGAAVGWFAHIMSEGTGLGILGDTVAGLVGAFAGALAAPKLGIAAGDSSLMVAVVALVGAAIVPVGARYLVGVWESQRRTDAETATRSPPQAAAEPVERNRSSVNERERNAPVVEERNTPAEKETTGLWAGVTSEARRPRGASLRAEPGSQLWFRKS